MKIIELSKMHRGWMIGDFQPILGVVYDHTKGNRKLKGRSGEARA